MSGILNMIRNWREPHLMLEHALETLSKFDIHKLSTDASSFEAQEFPLLIEDMQSALRTLKADCTKMERLSADRSWQVRPIPPLKQANNG